LSKTCLFISFRMLLEYIYTTQLMLSIFP
jgi:hypothetical protein